MSLIREGLPCGNYVGGWESIRITELKEQDFKERGKRRENGKMKRDLAHLIMVLGQETDWVEGLFQGKVSGECFPVLVIYLYL